MIRVITYGTYDLLHRGHIRLFRRAKALGDYLIVGVTSDDYDKSRGKINNQQSLIERISAIKETGLADEIIVEEYEGQKIDDIRRLGIDIFTVGSDWKGKFDYLNEYCKVVYLDRTKGISSTEERANNRLLRISCDAKYTFEKKFIEESKYVNGVLIDNLNYDAKFIGTTPDNHYEELCELLASGKHAICVSPIATSAKECKELFNLAQKHGVVLFDGIKTAFSTAFSRMLLLIKSGKIGKVVSVDATCTSMADFENSNTIDKKWNSICAWGPTAMFPVFQLLGSNYVKKQIVTMYLDEEKKFDAFTKIDFIYKNAVASIKVAKKAKSEGELIITGTKGYVWVPAPWWKTDYFEVRFENPQNNRRYFYQLDGDGIRNEISAFSKAVLTKKSIVSIPKEISVAICKVIEDFYAKKVIKIISISFIFISSIGNQSIINIFPFYLFNR